MTRLLCAALLGTCAMAGTAAADPASGTARPLTPGEMDRVTAGVLPEPAATWMLAGVIGAVPGALPGDGHPAGGTTVVASGPAASTGHDATPGGTPRLPTTPPRPPP